VSEWLSGSTPSGMPNWLALVVGVVVLGPMIALMVLGKVDDMRRPRQPSRFHQALYADNIRKRIAAGQITEAEGLLEFEIIMGKR
jgi:uncharacterized membrane protein